MSTMKSVCEHCGILATCVHDWLVRPPGATICTRTSIVQAMQGNTIYIIYIYIYKYILIYIYIYILIYGLQGYINHMNQIHANINSHVVHFFTCESLFDQITNQPFGLDSGHMAWPPYGIQGIPSHGKPCHAYISISLSFSLSLSLSLSLSPSIPILLSNTCINCIMCYCYLSLVVLICTQP